MSDSSSSRQRLPEPFTDDAAFVDAFVRSCGGLVSFIDTRERVVFATRALAAWFGTTPEAIHGRTLRELHGDDAYEIFSPWIARALAGEPVQYERASRHVDGRSLWISVNLHPHRDATGKVVGVFSTALEVNELKRTHDALGRALEEIASHIENTPLAVLEMGPDLRIKRWSPQAEEIFGWSFGEVRGRPPLEFGLVHRESAETARSVIAELAEDVTAAWMPRSS